MSNLIKQELFNAAIDYFYHLDNMKKEYPFGVDYCGEYVKSKAATTVESYRVAEAKYSALLFLTNMKHGAKYDEDVIRAIVDRYQNGETMEKIEAAEKEFYDLFSIKK